MPCALGFLIGSTTPLLATGAVCLFCLAAKQKEHLVWLSAAASDCRRKRHTKCSFLLFLFIFSYTHLLLKAATPTPPTQSTTKIAWKIGF